MKNFIFKSSDTDLQKIIQSIYTKLDTQSGNILYTTHQVDKILKIIQTLETNKALQKQVDQYFEDDETSPQTEPEAKDDLD